MKKFLKAIALFTIIAVMLVVSVACDDGNKDNYHKESITLEVGDTSFVQASEGTWAEYVYASSDDTVVSVSDKGVMSALKEGTAVITAKRGDVVVYEYTVTVIASTYVAPPVVDNTSYRIVLGKYESTIYLGGSTDITYAVYKNDTLVDETPTFALSSDGVVEIEPVTSGVRVKAKTAGTVTLTVKIGGFEAPCAINVYDSGVEYLTVPTVTKATATELGWNTVSNAGSYRVSLNGGANWTEVQTTSYAVTTDYNPLQVRVQALPAPNTNYARSNSGVLSSANLVVGNGKETKVLFNKTVAGNDNTIKANVDLELYYELNGDRFKIADKFVTWNVENTDVVTISGKTVAAVALGKTKASAKIIGGQVSGDIVVGIPVSSKADLDAIAFGQRNGDNTVWQKNKNYVLTGDIDYWSVNWHERYLAPIAMKTSQSGAAAPNVGVGSTWQFGIYGAKMNLAGSANKDANGVISNGIFYATLDGDGYAIKNAVIPCGSVVGDFGGATFMTGFNNFIGTMAYGGTLKNLAFLDLTFETPEQAAADPFMYNVATNPYLSETPFASTGIDIGKYSGKFSFGTALIGNASNAKVENVYVEAKMDFSTYHPVAANGLIVGSIGADDARYDGVKTEIKGCVVKTAYSQNAYYSFDLGAGALVGLNNTGLNTTVSHCFVITQAEAGYSAITEKRLFVYPDTARANNIGVSNLANHTPTGTNIAIYGTKAELLSYQSALIKEYDIWNRIP